MLHELIYFQREDVGVRDKIEFFVSELLLGFHEVCAESVLPSDLKRIWKVVDPLEFIEALVESRLVAGARPVYVPVVTLSLSKLIGFKQLAN